MHDAIDNRERNLFWLSLCRRLLMRFLFRLSIVLINLHMRLVYSVSLASLIALGFQGCKKKDDEESEENQLKMAHPGFPKWPK